MKKQNSKFYFHYIQGLMIPKNCNYKSIHENINKYIDLVQGLAQSIEKCFETDRRDYFVKNMETAITLLYSVYARWLATEGEAILRSIKFGLEPQIVQRGRTFINDLLTLSIEMQRVQNLADKDSLIISDVEKHADMANNISAVSTLIDDGEYKQAQDMIADLEERSAEVMLADLLELVVSQNFDEAGKLANVLKEKHKDAIKKLAISESHEMKSILAVDDRPEMLASITAALMGRFKVFGVTSGIIALSFIQKHTPDLFILDIDMPGMDGYTLSKTLRNSEKHLSTPIIFLTSHSSREHVIKAMKAGGNDFIVKPANHTYLLTKVTKFLS